MNCDIKQDGTVVTIKKSRKVQGHIGPIQAKDVRLNPNVAALTQETKKDTPESLHKQAQANFLLDLIGIISKNPVYNTHRTSPAVIARHMCLSAENFNRSLFVHNSLENQKKYDQDN